MRLVARHALGLCHGVPGARHFRRILSDPARLDAAGPDVFLDALAALELAAIEREVDAA